MPISLAPISRRRFLRGAIGVAGALAIAPTDLLGVAATAPSEVDPDRLALLSDIHLPTDRALMHKTGINMWEQCVRACREAAALSPRPSAALVNGDCAYSKGLPGDYKNVLAAVEILRTAGLPVHLALGNHDDRGNLLSAMAPDDRPAGAPEDRRVALLRLPHADWYMLDSLEKTNQTPGLLGNAQLEWLAKSLDAAPDRPAIVMLHHQPDDRPPEKVSGLRDTAPFLEVARPRRQVKAIIFGHTHRWEHRAEEGLHFINLPTTAYIFRPGEPAGWVDAHVKKDRLTLQLHAITPDHPKDGETLEFAWR